MKKKGLSGKKVVGIVLVALALSMVFLPNVFSGLFESSVFGSIFSPEFTSSGSNSTKAVLMIHNKGAPKYEYTDFVHDNVWVKSGEFGASVTPHLNYRVNIGFSSTLGGDSGARLKSFWYSDDADKKFNSGCWLTRNGVKVSVYLKNQKVSDKFSFFGCLGTTKGPPCEKGNVNQWRSINISESDLQKVFGRTYGWFTADLEAEYSSFNGSCYPESIKTRVNGIKFFNESSLCNIPSGYVLVTEDLVAGTTFSRDSLRSKVDAFCWSYPLWKLDNDDKTLIKKSTDEYEVLTNGGTLTVPAGQVWRIYYVSKPEKTLDIACDPSKPLYDTNSGKCLSLPGLEYYCSAGTFSQEEMACIVQPVTKCADPDAVFVQETGECIKFVKTTYSCNGVSYASLEEAQSACSVPVNVQYFCQGIGYDSLELAQQKCGIEVPVQYYCKGTAYGSLEEAQANCVEYSDITYSCNGVFYDSVEEAQLACNQKVPLMYLCNGVSYSTLEEAQSACTNKVEVKEIECPSGSELKITDEGTKKCVFKPIVECEKGTLQTNELGEEYCAYFPPTVEQVPVEKTVDSLNAFLFNLTGVKTSFSLGRLLLALVLGLSGLFLVFSK